MNEDEQNTEDSLQGGNFALFLRCIIIGISCLFSHVFIIFLNNKSCSFSENNIGKLGVLFKRLQEGNITSLLWVGFYLGKIKIELLFQDDQLKPLSLYKGESQNVLALVGSKDSMICNLYGTGSLYVSQLYMDMAANSTSALFTYYT